MCDTILQAEPLHVCITGAAGQIAYSLLYSVAKGDVFGQNRVTIIMTFVQSQGLTLAFLLIGETFDHTHYSYIHYFTHVCT